MLIMETSSRELKIFRKVLGSASAKGGMDYRKLYSVRLVVELKLKDTISDWTIKHRR